MADLIKGDEVLFFIQVDGDFVPVACLTSSDLPETTDAMETTVRGNNGWRSYTPSVQDYTVSIAGVIERSSSFSYVFLQGLKRNQIVFIWRMATSGSEILDEGSAFITSLTLSAPAGDIVSFSATLTPGVGGIKDVMVWSQDGDNVVTQNGTNLTQL
ncbi:MAG TPA: phage tail tube protein [Verrucomicrobiae bacterium]|nr:phage tail tube protein [Verrucomicrobiae bacterium]